MSSFLERIAEFAAGPIAGGNIQKLTKHFNRFWPWSSYFRPNVCSWILCPNGTAPICIFHSSGTCVKEETRSSVWHDLGSYRSIFGL